MTDIVTRLLHAPYRSKGRMKQGDARRLMDEAAGEIEALKICIRRMCASYEKLESEIQKLRSELTKLTP
jgi:chaperonin cofactor prefoldin